MKSVARIEHHRGAVLLEDGDEAGSGHGRSLWSLRHQATGFRLQLPSFAPTIRGRCPAITYMSRRDEILPDACCLLPETSRSNYGGFVLRAIDAEVGAAERHVEEPAVVRRRFPGTHVSSEEPAGDTHPGDGYEAGPLQ